MLLLSSFALASSFGLFPVCSLRERPMGFAPKGCELKSLRQTGAEKEEEEEEEVEQEVVDLEKSGGEREGFIEREEQRVVTLVLMMIDWVRRV